MGNTNDALEITLPADEVDIDRELASLLQLHEDLIDRYSTEIALERMKIY